MKALSIILLIILIIGGSGYLLLLNDIDRDPKIAFKTIVSEVSKLGKTIEPDILSSKKLSPVKKEFKSFYINSDNKKQSLRFSIEVITENTTERLKVVILEGDHRISNKTIYFEPAVKDEKVTWKCAGGSLLQRHRSRKCSTGIGIQF